MAAGLVMEGVPADCIRQTSSRASKH